MSILCLNTVHHCLTIAAPFLYVGCREPCVHSCFPKCQTRKRPLCFCFPFNLPDASIVFIFTAQYFIFKRREGPGKLIYVPSLDILPRLLLSAQEMGQCRIPADVKALWSSLAHLDIYRELFGIYKTLFSHMPGSCI